MRKRDIVIAVLAAVYGILNLASPAGAQEADTDNVVISEEGDSIITFERRIFDFGPLNQGDPDSLERMLNPNLLATERDIEALKLETVDRDRRRILAARPGIRALSSTSASGPDTSRPVGKIPVQEGVTPTGARTYAVPVATAPGIAFTPQIALYYNSQSSYGPAGYGWSISGLSAISVTNKTKYYNGETGPALWNDPEAVYALDGVPLVKNSKTELDDEYQLETARGHIVVKKHLEGDSVAYFTALYPDGSRAIFGQEKYRYEGLSRYIYPVTEIEDVRGNRMVFKYIYSLPQGHKYYISSIEYGFSDDGTPAGRIEFDYEDDTHGHAIYFAGAETRSSGRVLKSIVSYSGDEELCRYDLSHELDGNDQRLVSIGCTSDGKSLNPLEFSYGDSQTEEDYDDGTVDLIRKDNLFLSQYFDDADDADVVYKSGKFIDGAVGDGLVAYPNFPIYGQTGTVKKWFLGEVYYTYGSKFSPDQKILVAPMLTSVSGVQSFEAGEGFQCAEAVDIDADGVDEIVQVNFAGTSGNYTKLKITVREFNASRTLVVKSSFTVNVDGVVNEGDVAYSPARRIYNFGDYAGNGKVQMLTTLYNKDPNNTARTSYSALIDLDAGKKLSETHIIDFAEGSERYLYSLDLDNDGRTELCWATPSGFEVYNLSGSGFCLTKTFQNTLTSREFPGPDKDRDMFVTDFNGDGYVDFVSRHDGNYNAYCYTGNTFIGVLFQGPIPSEGDEVMFYDINRDGLADLLHRHFGTLDFYLNDKGTIIAADKISSSMYIDRETKFLPCNILNCCSLTNFATIDGAEIRTYDFSQDVSEDRLLTMFTDSHGVITINEYEDMASSHYAYVNSPDRNYGEGFGKKNFPMSLLKNGRSYMFPSMTVLSHLNYRYFDAAYNWQGLGFCGFGKVETTDLLGSPEDYLVSTVTYDPTMFGAAVSEERALWSERDIPFRKTTNKYDSHSTTYGKLNPRLTMSVYEDSQAGITTSTSYEYGDYDLPLTVKIIKSTGRTLQSYERSLQNSKGYVIREQHIIIDSLKTPGDTLIQATTFDRINERTDYTYINRISESLYLIGMPDSQKVSKSRPFTTTWVERRIWEYDDTLMLPTKRTDFVGDEGDNKLRETRWTYDSFGNVISETSASYNSSVFLGDSYTYDGSGRYLLSHTDALGRTETYSGHNKFGKPTTVTDDKGRVTQITYDEWGNEISCTYPEGSKEETLVQWGGEGLYTVTRTLTGQPSEVTHYDAGDRVLRTGTLRFDGSWLYTDSRYDEGRLSKVSVPFKGDSPSLWNTYEYDAYNRRTKFTDASGNVTAWSYDKWSVTETRNGIQTTKTLDPDGRAVEIKDGGGRLVYAYRADGKLTAVAKLGHKIRGIVLPDPSQPLPTIEWTLSEKVSFGYDGYGRRNSVTDPSSGRQTDSETWAADGSSILVHTNPNGTITVKRDCYGRVTEIDREGEFTTTYTYGADGLLLGEVSTNGTSRSYSYDGFDRLLSETETVPDGKWLRKDYDYTSGSRVASIEYTSQSGNITTEYYDYANGHNILVRTQDGRTVWSLMSENELGLPTKALTGTVERSYSYSGYGQITGRTMGGVQDFGYSFSPLTGNLTVRIDRTRNITENFGYDSLNRLTDNNGRAVTYAENGNITSMETVGTFTYGKSSRPYQMTEAELTGDDIYPERDQTVSYTSFLRPSRLNEGGRSASFTYNGSHERVKMYVADGTEAVLTRYYIGGCYELDVTGGTTVERLYLDGDAYSAPMVMVREDDSGWELLNIGRDHLGSVTHLATYDGALIAEYSYDAWGRLRDPETQEIWSPCEEPELLLGRGFTGHEHLPWFGLVNMNARLYDPALGRFLSPDPYIQLPDFTQNFNRYSYCLNNPLIFADESGEFFVLDSFIAGLFIGGWDKAVQMAKNDLKIWGGLFTSDPNKSVMGRVWEVVSRFIWQPLQTIGGFLTAHACNSWCLAGGVESVDYLYGATVVSTVNDGWGAVTQGNFIVGDSDLKADPSNDLFQHEYGHYIQSQDYGYLYYAKFGVPSLFSKGSHRDHPVEQDANIRSLKYYYQKGLYDSFWDKDSNVQKINGYDTDLDFNDSSNQEALQNIIKLNWYDFFDPFIISSIVNTIVLNTKY